MTDEQPRTNSFHSTRGKGKGLPSTYGNNHAWNTFKILKNQDPMSLLRTDVVQDEINTNKQNENTDPSHQEDLEDTKVADLSPEVDSSRKKKTPMCLINELARHHKLQPQYRLTEESGPAHLKTFTVNLKLGNEDYTASGQSIKKAQHAAAQLALQQTSFQQPELKPKPKNQICFPNNKPITPTVELNALTMKLNLSPVYTPFTSPDIMPARPFGYTNSNRALAPPARGDFRNLQSPSQEGRYLNADFQQPRFPGVQPRMHYTGNQRFFYNRLSATPMIHRVNLTVGNVSVTGEGPTPQAARHHAARQALEQLHQLQSENSSVSTVQSEESLLVDGDPDSNIKSPVSLVHELALKLNQTVEFTVVSESGPPHMKSFLVSCKLGDVCTQGDGNCKKLAKKKAAELMIEELKKNHPIGSARSGETSAQRLRTKPKSVAPRKKPRNLVKEVTSGANASIGGRQQDPISHLVQLQQGRKEKEPLFVVVSERGIPRQPEFVVQVTVGSLTATGVGPKKKDAKRAAAKKALEALGVEFDSKSEIQSSVASYNEQTSLPCVRQKIPGLLMIGGTKETQESVDPVPKPIGGTVNKEVAVISQPKNSCEGSETRLRYLAQIMNYEVDFSDFPKGNKGEILCLVTLNTVPRKVCHAVGSTVEEAHDNAAASILKLIADGGIDLAVGESNQENLKNEDKK